MHQLIRYTLRLPLSPGSDVDPLNVDCYRVRVHPFSYLSELKESSDVA